MHNTDGETRSGGKPKNNSLAWSECTSTEQDCPTDLVVDADNVHSLLLHTSAVPDDGTNPASSWLSTNCGTDRVSCYISPSYHLSDARGQPESCIRRMVGVAARARAPDAIVHSWQATASPCCWQAEDVRTRTIKAFRTKSTLDHGNNSDSSIRQVVFLRSTCATVTFVSFCPSIHRPSRGACAWQACRVTWTEREG